MLSEASHSISGIPGFSISFVHKNASPQMSATIDGILHQSQFICGSQPSLVPGERAAKTNR